MSKHLESYFKPENVRLFWQAIPQHTLDLFTQLAQDPSTVRDRTGLVVLSQLLQFQKDTLDPQLALQASYVLATHLVTRPGINSDDPDMDRARYIGTTGILTNIGAVPPGVAIVRIKLGLASLNGLRRDEVEEVNRNRAATIVLKAVKLIAAQRPFSTFASDDHSYDPIVSAHSSVVIRHPYSIARDAAYSVASHFSNTDNMITRDFFADAAKTFSSLLISEVTQNPVHSLDTAQQLLGYASYLRDSSMRSHDKEITDLLENSMRKVVQSYGEANPYHPYFMDELSSNYRIPPGPTPVS